MSQIKGNRGASVEHKALILNLGKLWPELPLCCGQYVQMREGGHENRRAGIEGTASSRATPRIKCQ